ncbi:MAG: glycosyltransferase family 4 protein [Kiritimatiellia bacterium]
MDYQPAVAQRAGIGRYAKMLAGALSNALAEEDVLRLFYCDFRRRAVAPELPRVEPAPFHALPGAVMQKLWHHARFPPFNWVAGAADVFHFTNFTTRPLTAGKSVVSIHDMSFARFPQFAERRNLRHLSAGIERSAKAADAIITISEFSKREIEALLPVARGKVHVTYLGIGSEFGVASEGDVARVRAEIGVTRPFMLAVGTVEPRKNLEFLVDVFERVAPQGIDLVVAGAPGWKCDAILNRFETTAFPGQLHYLRFVPDGLLAALYSAAALYVIPSHYEGFGFGPLEAMACGTPVLSSSGGSLPEVLGDAACVMEGCDPDAWAERALAIISGGELRDRLIRDGARRAARFTWQGTAAATLDVYRKALES